MVAAKEFEWAAVFARFFPCLDDESDGVDAAEAGKDLVAVHGEFDVLETGFHHDDAFEAPVDGLSSEFMRSRKGDCAKHASPTSKTADNLSNIDVLARYRNE